MARAGSPCPGRPSAGPEGPLAALSSHLSGVFRRTGARSAPPLGPIAPGEALPPSPIPSRDGHRNSASIEKPKSRTCLVPEVEDRAGGRFIEIAYGTSADNGANVGDAFWVESPEEMAIAGIHKPTRFVCARRVCVTPDHPGWDVNPKYRTPVVGHLPPAAIRKMNAIRAKIQARRDIAADRRASRRREFTVEHRRRRRIIRPAKAVRG